MPGSGHNDLDGPEAARHTSAKPLAPGVGDRSSAEEPSKVGEPRNRPLAPGRTWFGAAMKLAEEDDQSTPKYPALIDIATSGPIAVEHRWHGPHWNRHE